MPHNSAYLHALLVGCRDAGVTGLMADFLYVGYIERHARHVPREHQYAWSFALCVCGAAFSLLAALAFYLAPRCCHPRFTPHPVEPYRRYRHYRVAVGPDGCPHLYPYPGPYYPEVRKAWGEPSAVAEKRRECEKSRNGHVWFAPLGPAGHGGIAAGAGPGGGEAPPGYVREKDFSQSKRGPDAEAAHRQHRQHHHHHHHHSANTTATTIDTAGRVVPDVRRLQQQQRTGEDDGRQPLSTSTRTSTSSRAERTKRDRPPLPRLDRQRAGVLLRLELPTPIPARTAEQPRPSGHHPQRPAAERTAQGHAGEGPGSASSVHRPASHGGRGPTPEERLGGRLASPRPARPRGGPGVAIHPSLNPSHGVPAPAPAPAPTPGGGGREEVARDVAAMGPRSGAGEGGGQTERQKAVSLQP